MRRPKFTSKYLIEHISSKLIPAVKQWEQSYQPPVIHLGRVLSVGDGIARVYGLRNVQVSWGVAGSWGFRTEIPKA
jgi:F-type H+-transporting ATPase subunit alpha